MSLKIGLVGLPNAGKSTLFQALTRQEVLIADYPFATIEPNLAYRKIKDQRLEELSKIYPAAKKTPALIQVVDIAGLIKGAHQGEGLGNQFLANIRQTDMVAYVGGLFKESRQALSDLEIILTEIMLADWQVLENQITKLRKVANLAENAQLFQSLNQAQQLLDAQIYLYDSNDRDSLRAQLKYLNLLSLKPLLVVFNLKSSDLNDQGLREKLRPKHPTIFLSAQLEEEFSQLQDDDQTEFLKAYQLKESGLQTLTQESLKLLKWQTFLTAGDKEVRSWLIRKGSLAPEAAGVIHGDIQRGFIAAEVVSFKDLMQHGSWSKAKAAGACRIEGKKYCLQADDVVDFKFNV